MEKVRDQLMGHTIDEFLEIYNHNYAVDMERLLKLVKLVQGAFRPRMEGWSIEEVISYCLYKYGGTVVDSLVDALWNS